MLTVDDGAGADAFVYGANRIGIDRAEGSNGAFSYDPFGSALRNPATADVVRADAYSPYGQQANSAFNDPLAHTPAFGYRGELMIDTTVHLRARTYAPAEGVFTTRDPLDGAAGTPTVTSPYHYTANDPINKVDPTGRRPGDCEFTVLDACFDTLAPGLQSTLLSVIGQPSNPNSFGPAVDDLVAQALGDLFKEIAGWIAGEIAEGVDLPDLPDLPWKLPNLPDLSKLWGGNNCDADYNYLENRAKDLHSKLDARAQNHRTTAVLRTLTAEGGCVDVVATSGNRRLPREIRESLKPGEEEVTVRGEHAEINALLYAAGLERLPIAIGVSRKFCSECSSRLQNDFNAQVKKEDAAVWDWE
ncbi:MAG: hypothetical protein JJLCMIEE_03418 [Acidimicrobiales bacterium]|nr:hypothetical protein [Acidimicrobiales bacterium]